MPRTDKFRILIIDDDLEFRENIRMILLAEGYAPQVAEDAVDGGKLLLVERPDLVICDVSMPYMDGLELLSLLRKDEGTGALPVILVSGRSDIDVLGRAAELGASDYLIKPITRERLLASIGNCLKKAGETDA